MYRSLQVSHFPEIDERLLQRYDVAAPRYTSYPTVPVWSALHPAQYEQALARAAATAELPLSLYLHIPFCRSRCSYCGCNVVITRDEARVERYLTALACELSLVAGYLGRRRRIARLHLGGGTPTFLEEAQLERLWQHITSHFSLAADAELAVEIDPSVTSAAQLALLTGLGFRRLSMGVQDFAPEVQAAVRRPQSVAETAALCETARHLGFASINFDLIYGLPRQTAASWRRTLEQVCELAPDRVAVFSFAYVPEVRRNQRVLAGEPMPAGRDKLRLFQLAWEHLCGHGYQTIGFDHFARPDDPLAVARREGRLMRDFQGYTTVRAPDTVGIGVSAISQVGGCYAQNSPSLRRHAEALARGELPVEKGHVLSADDRRRQRIIGELMCNERVDLGRDAGCRLAPELARLQELEQDGLVTRHGSLLALTPLGRVLMRNVAMVFDAHAGRAAAAPAPGAPVYSRVI